MACWRNAEVCTLLNRKSRNSILSCGVSLLLQAASVLKPTTVALMRRTSRLGKRAGSLGMVCAQAMLLARQLNKTQQ
jgi:hypothetical protein